MKKTTPYARKRRHAPAPRDPLASLRLLDNCRPYEPEDIADRLLRARAALECLQAGTADTADFDRLAMAINVAKVRALHIDETLANAVEAAQTAMEEVRDRFQRIGKWGFNAQQLAAIAHALEAYEAIHSVSSPLQMHQALHVVHGVICKQTGVQA